MRMPERLVFVRKASGLVRELSWLDVVIWSVACPTASGLMYYMVNTVNDYPGANPVLSFLIGGLIVLPVFATLAYLMRIMPRSGGPYIVISRLVDPSVGYLIMMVNAVSWGMTVGIMCWVGTGVLGSCAGLAGHISHSTGLVAAGEWLASKAGSITVSVVLIILFWAISLVSMRAVRMLMQLSFWLPLAATLVLACAGWFTRNAAAAWDRTWGEGTFQKVIEIATANGWQPAPFSWSSTIGMLLVVFWAYSGIEAISFAAGEVKRPQQTLFTGILAGVVATMLLYAAMGWAAVRPFQNSHFVSAYVFLQQNHPDLLSGVMPVLKPSLPLFLGPLLPNPWLAVVVMLLVSLWFYNTAVPSLVAASRTWFAMSFDRQLPSAFAAVNRRGVPTWATHMACLFALAGALLELAGVKVVLGMMDVCAFFFFWPLGLAAVVLPYRRPDIYSLSPTQARFLGIPVVSWLGVFTTGIGWYFIAFSIKWFTPAVQAVFGITIMILIYVYLRGLHQCNREGIDVGQIYAELPPE